MTSFIPLFLVLFLVAAALRQTSVMTVLYLVAGLYIAGRWISVRSIHNVQARRVINSRAFLNQTIPVILVLKNRGLLPLIWLRLHESLPVGMISPNFFQRVTSLGSKASRQFDYRLHAYKRGFYEVGPLFLSNGDLLGLSEENQIEVPCEPLIVYPKIVPILSLGVPSQAPYGKIRSANPIFEDPSRVMGKRDYTRGDSLRRIDWKASAAYGGLLVKQFEPSITLETNLYLNLDSQDYPVRRRIDLTELAIVTAASISSWAIRQKHALGLVTNGADPLRDNVTPDSIPAHKGMAHLTRVLDLLARVEVSSGEPILPLIARFSPSHNWGATIVLITGRVDDPLIETLLPLRRRGLNPVVIPIGPILNLHEIKRRAEYFGFAVYPVQSWHDLETWR